MGASQESAAELRDQLDRERAASRLEIARLESDLAERLAAGQAEATRAQQRLAADLSANRDKQAALEADLAASRATAREEIGRLEQRLARESEKSLEIQALRQAQLEAEPARPPESGIGIVTKLPPEASQAPEPDQERLPEAAQPGQQLALLPSTPASGDGKLWIAALGALVLAALALAWAAAGLLHRRRTAALGAAAGGPGIAVTPGGTGPAAAARLAGAIAVPGGSEDLLERPGLEKPGQPSADQATPQSLVEALRRGDLAQFKERFGEMAGLTGAQLERILHNPSGADLAIVCRALAMDKLVLASIFLLSHKARSGGLEVRPQDLSTAMAHYDHMAQDAAGKVLETWRGDPDLPPAADRLQDGGRAEGGQQQSE